MIAGLSGCNSIQCGVPKRVRRSTFDICKTREPDCYGVGTLGIMGIQGKSRKYLPVVKAGHLRHRRTRHLALPFSSNHNKNKKQPSMHLHHKTLSNLSNLLPPSPSPSPLFSFTSFLFFLHIQDFLYYYYYHYYYYYYYYYYHHHPKE